MGSTAVKDLFDNAENLDRLINDQAADVWDDRLGHSRKTWHGIEKQAQLDISTAVAQAVAEAVAEGTAAAEEYRDEAEIARDAAEDARDDAVAAAGAIGPQAFYATHADALAAAAGVFPRQLFEVAKDDTRGGSRTRYWAEMGALDFWVDLDQVRKDLANPQKGPAIVAYDDGTAQDVLDEAKPMQSYTAMRNYTGRATGIRITTPGISGFFQRRGGSQVDDKGRYIVDALGRTWERLLSGFPTPAMFGADPKGVADSTAALEDASKSMAALGGGLLHVTQGTYKYKRLTLRSGVVLQGDGPQCTHLVCTDPSALDAGVSHGSSMRAQDNGQRVYRAAIRGIFISSGSAGTAANQEEYQKIMGINLCGCERTILEDVSFGGFGQGAVVLARAEGGAEGLGFVNTTQDGNYNVGSNLSIAGCGAYNAAASAIWFKYKANSNKFYSIFGKGLPGAYLFGIDRSNDNFANGGTLESGVGVANIGFGTVSASGNTIIGFRIEGASGDGYVLGPMATNNTIIAGYHTGVVGEDFRLINPDNRIISNNTNYLRSKQFPPATNYSTQHNLGALQVTSINGDPTYPLFVKSKDYATPGSYPYQVFYNDIANGTIGTVLGRLAWRNGDSSAGAAGVSAAVEAVLEDTGGSTGLGFHTGTGTTLAEKFRITAAGVLRPTSDNTQAFGAPDKRASVIFAGTAAISTSDERSKQDIAELDEAEIRVAVRLKGLIRKYRFRDAALVKGEDARIHIGVIAQDVIAAFAAEGLDAFKYALLCYDEWGEQVIEHEALYDHRPTGVFDEEGEEIHARTVIRPAWTEVIAAGNRYGVRYEELLAFVIAAL